MGVLDIYDDRALPTGVQWANGPADAARGGIGGLGQSLAGGFAAMRSGEGLTNTAARYNADLYGEMIAAASKTGVKPERRQVSILGRELFTMPGRVQNPVFARSPDGLFDERNEAEDQLFRWYEQARAADPSLPDFASPEKFRAEVAKRRQADQATAQEQIAEGGWPIIGGLGGALLASPTDPLVLMTLPLGASQQAGRTAAIRIAKTALAEAKVQAGVAAVLTPLIAADAQGAGMDYGVTDAATDIALGGALGAAFGGALGAARQPGVQAGVARAAEVAVAPVRWSARHAAAGLRRLKRPLTLEEKGALNVLDREADLAAGNPYEAGVEGEAIHEAQMAEARSALEEDRANDLPDLPPESPATPARPASRLVTQAQPEGLQSGHVYQFSARNLKTDAERFQYKSDGDAEGVTGRLRFVTEWNDDAAGMLIVWQARDGTLFVGDGHQRSGLARRLIGQGRYDDINLTAKLYREADGFTSDMVMARAAGANILNGSGTPLDAARIIRRFGIDSDYLQGFDRTAAFGRDAYGIARLSDDAYGMVLNGDAETATLGAIIGRVAPDQPKMHASLLQAMRMADVANVTQAELMIRDMLAAPRVTEHQETMFGMLEVTRGLYAERAQILDRALQLVRREKRVLTTAAEHGEILEAAGTNVDRARARNVAEENARLADVVARLARMTGNPVNDALSTAAARMVEKKGKPGAAARDFVNELRARPDIINDIIAGRGAGTDSGGDAGRGRGSATADGGEGSARPADAGGAGRTDGGAARAAAGRAAGDADGLSAAARFNSELQGFDPAKLPPGNEAARTAHRAAGGEVGPFGPVHRELAGDWQAAVARLSADRDGEVPAALRHPAVGDIDVIWGKPPSRPDASDGYGLAKILQKHEGIAERLPDILARMEVRSLSPNRAILESPDHKAAVSLEFAGNEKAWLLSAYEKAPAAEVYLRSGADRRAASPDAGLDTDIARRAADDNAAPTSAFNRADADVDAVAANARMGEAVRGFDDPDGAAAQQQAEHLAHDMRADLDAEEPGGLFDLFGADEPDARAELRAIDNETSDFARVKNCLADPGGNIGGAP